MGIHLVHAPISLSDLRQTLRRLNRERGFSLTVLLTLALCIGANVAIFAVVDAILIRSLPFPEPDQLVTLYNRYPGAGVERSSSSVPNYYERTEGMTSFSSISRVRGGNVIIGESGAPQRVTTFQISPEFFDTIQTPLAMGRAFTQEEMIYNASSVAILTDEFWESYFDKDPDILGMQFRVNGFDVTVVGILQPGFRFLSNNPKFLTPSAHSIEDKEPKNRHSNNYNMIARLAPGVTVKQAQAEMDAFNARLMESDPYAHLLKDAQFGTSVVALHADHIRSVRPILLLLQGGVIALLLIGGVNLINLLLVRASGRAKELAVRQALGASRRHVARETLLETMLLAIGGGLLGLGLGALGIHLLDTFGTDKLPLGATIRFDTRVAFTAIAVSIGVGIALAIPVVWFNLHGRLANVLHTESRSGTTSRAAQRVRHAFIVTQIGLAFILLAGAGLLSASMQQVLAMDPGFRSGQLATARINLPWKNYQQGEERVAFSERLIHELESLPGVTSVGMTTSIPFGNNNSDNATTVEGYERAPGESIRTHNISGNSGDLWKTLGIPLIEGRYLEDADNHNDTQVCLVDEAFVNHYWPGDSALGRRLAMEPEFNEAEAYTIVGVVKTVKRSELSETNPLGAIYLPMLHRANLSMFVALRTDVAPETLFQTMRDTVLRIDPELPLDDIKTMESRIEDSLLLRKSPAMLAILFAAVALALAGVGTYGVLAYAVAQRRREIGVRMAIGALPSQIRSQFMKLGGRLLFGGTVLGVVGAWLLGRMMKSLLFGVSSFHIGTVLMTFVIMGLVSMAACLLPSRRAARVSPLEALSED